jgi:HK97 family phage portal protein
MTTTWWQRLLGKARTTTTDNRLGAIFAPAYAPSAGWWRDNPTEQLRQYQSWVYAAVNAIGQEVARQRPFLFINTGQADHEQTPLPHTHPLCRLLDHPNPWLTSWELWYLTIVSLELTGNSFWYLAPQSGTDTPAELWMIPTPWVKVVPHVRDYIAHYEVSANGVQTERFQPHEIIHLKYPNPLDPHYGLSPLQANAVTVDANLELLKSRYQTFLSGARPGIVLQTEQTLTAPTVTRLEETLEAKFAGRKQWNRPMILEQGLKASPWTLTPAEMDFLNSSKLTRDEILAIFRVPGPITGLVENVGLGANIWQGARVMFCEGTIQPKLELIAQTLTRDLAGRYGPDVTVTFPDCSPRNQTERRLDDELDAKLGLRTYNEIRKARGLKPYIDARFDSPMI